MAIATAALKRCRSGIWELRRQPGTGPDSGRDGLHFFEHLHEVIDRVVEEINAPSTNFANSHRLLLSGEAGVGKSNLLADVVEHHVAQGFPAVLMPGGAFSDAEPWRQIAEQLELTNASSGCNSRCV